MKQSVAMGVSVFLLAAAALAAAQGGPYERQKIDAGAATRGRALYAQHCINCHGSTAKGGERGPDLIRSLVVLRDRQGNAIGPALTSSSHQARLTETEVVDLSHFLHQRVESTASNRNARGPIDVFSGDPEAGRAYFNGPGRCSSCHSPTGDLAGLAKRYTDGVTLQQRWLFPSLRRGGDKQVEVTVTSGGTSTAGVLVRQDDFTVSLREPSGQFRSFSRAPGVDIVVRDPLAVHGELLDHYTDRDIHNVTTYLSTLR